MATRAAGKKQKRKKTTHRISHTRKPDHLTDFEWQYALRKQVAADEQFRILPPATGMVYGDYTVTSVKSKQQYKVALRSADNSLNFCSCPDFKTNQLGTCKHIEAILLKLNAKPATRRALQENYSPDYTSVYLSYVGERRVKIRIGTAQRQEYRKLASFFFSPANELKGDVINKFELFLSRAEQLHNGFRCYPDALEYIIQQRDNNYRKSTVKKLGKKMLTGITKAKLFPYQQTGALFAATAGRCILADDMGLGKTLQAITANEVMHKHFHISRAIIVCPTSLKYQWKNEIIKFTGNTKICVVEGHLLNRMKQYAQQEHDYFIVSYNVAGNDYEYLNEMGADLLILDEAQRIKNWRSKVSAKIKRIKTPYAFVLTGTPVENNIEELYSLMQIVNPYLLGSLHHFLQKHQLTDEHTGKVTGYRDLNQIGELLSGVMLRRTKKEVLKELPARMDKNLLVPMTEEQMKMHKEGADTVAKLIHKWRRMGFLSEEDRQRLLNNLNVMRMVCDSTYILDQSTNYQTKLDEVQNILEEIMAMEGEKVVVFSQWERMTRLVAQMLDEQGIGFKYLHGGVASKNREELFTVFNTDPECRVFLSTDAGGVGLNLQAAAYIINLDIPWNPAILEQRIGRIYRLGQKKNVSVINLVAKGTIEERMLDVLQFKRSVAAGILDGGDSDIFMGDDKFKQFMKSVESVTGIDQQQAELPVVVDAGEQLEEKGMQELAPPAANFAEAQEAIAATDAAIGETEKQAEAKAESHTAKRLVTEGASFFENLVQSLSTPDGVRQLTRELVETDEKTGQSYIKIPVSGNSVVENALGMLGVFLKGIK
ncbi:MAG: DEAD/DEAH box helicase [Chitinophagaceae bacterium]|nr:DEAD/DEAH box helicase [Chitinophagaceae bacterium]